MHKILDESLWDRHIDTIHRHVVAIISCPTKSQLREVTRSNHHTIEFIAQIHENLSSLTSLTILVGDIVHVDVVLNILEMLYTGILNAYLLDCYAKMLHERDGVMVSAVGCSEARHSHTHDTSARIFELIECLDANEQGKRRVKSSADTNNHSLAVGVNESLGKSCNLYVEYLLT